MGSPGADSVLQAGQCVSCFFSCPPLQGRKLPETAPGLRTPHHLPLAGEAQVGGAQPRPVPILLPCSPRPWAVWPPEALSTAFPCRNLIEPEQCTFCFTASRIDICLRKRQSQRWGGLEAPATRGLPTSSLHCLVLGTWTPTPCHMLLTTSPPFPLFKVQWVVQRSPCRQVHPPWIQPHREVHPIP